jgi:uncharacterized iron-regulated protein
MKLSAQDKPAYALYNSEGKEITWNKMVKDLKNEDIVFFGEQHNDPIAHWLEYELFVALFLEKGKAFVGGAEMFESDNQIILDEYLKGLIDDKKFEEEARIWPNHITDYKPVLTYAHDNSIPFVATNIPRRYSNMVFKGGFEALNNLSSEALKYISPLPIKFDIGLSCYKSMMEMDMGHGPKPDEKLPKAQAIKDATMAFFILKNRQDGTLFFHINGSYHSDNFEGIVWYLKQAKPELKIKTITNVSQKEIEKLEDQYKGKASYVLVVPASMTKTR